MNTKWPTQVNMRRQQLRWVEKHLWIEFGGLLKCCWRCLLANSLGCVWGCPCHGQNSNWAQSNFLKIKSLLFIPTNFGHWFLSSRLMVKATWKVGRVSERNRVEIKEIGIMIWRERKE